MLNVWPKLPTVCQQQVWWVTLGHEQVSTTMVAIDSPPHHRTMIGDYSQSRAVLMGTISEHGP